MLTRSRIRKTSVASSPGLNADISHSEAEESEQDIEDHLSRVVQGIQKLKQEASALRKKNQELERKLRKRNETVSRDKFQHSSTRGATSLKASNIQVKELKEKVKDLERDQKKNHKIIKSLRKKEIKNEVAELQDDVLHDPPADFAHQMRKLLRKFNDLMLMTSLDEGESCPICFDPLESKKTCGLPCQHLVCQTCLQGISRGADETVKCPQCRKDFPRDEVELVHMTASEQWDELLEVAKAWSSLDHRTEDETSEEEAEEEFIANDTSSGNSNTEIQSDAVQSSSSDNINSSLSPRRSISPLLYSQSPTKAKRQRMEELAQQRLNKRRK